MKKRSSIYGCHDYSDMPLKSIARYVGLGHRGTVSRVRSGYQETDYGRGVERKDGEAGGDL